MSKYCADCNVEKTLINTSKNGAVLQSYCKACAAKRAKIYRARRIKNTGKDRRKFKEEFFNINEDAIYC